MWRDPRLDERAHPASLQGRRVQIYWDGDRVFYPAVVLGFDPILRKHTVCYEGDPNPYEEDLITGAFQIWDDHGAAPHFVAPALASEGYNIPAQPFRTYPHSGDDRSVVRNSRATYAEMILDAIQSLRDKNGSSLQAVRKWIATTYPDTQNKQKASFNQLTLKAITKLVAEGSVEKNKSSFRLSRQYLGRLKDDQRDQYIGVDLGKGRKKFVYAPGMELVGTSMEHNKVLRKELAEAREKRDLYLSTRMQNLAPFLPEKDSYFARKERTALVSQMQMKFERDPVAHVATRNSTALGSDVFAVPHQHRFPEELDPTDISHVNVDGDEILRLLTKLGIVSQDIALKHSPHQLTLAGIFVHEAPPLELARDFQLLTEDALAMGETIAEGDFQGFKIVWPGRRLPIHRDSLLKSFEGYLDWKHVYFLEKQDPVTLQITRQTALRDHTGIFIPHKMTYMRTTMSYARRKTVPISNLITLQYKCPRTGLLQKIVREYCASGHFANIYRRLLHDTLRAHPHLVQAFTQHNLETQARKQALIQPIQPTHTARAIEVPASVEQWHVLHAEPPLQSPPSTLQAWYKMMIVTGRQFNVSVLLLQSLEQRSQLIQAAVDSAPSVSLNPTNQLLSNVLAAAPPTPATDAASVSSDALGSQSKELTSHKAAGDEVKSDDEVAKGGEIDESIESLSKKTLRSVKLLQVPASITATLHQHQIEGFSWMVHMFQHGMPMILGDQMGLGKTIQSITFLAYLRDVLGVPGPHLVVVPLSVMSNWLAEVERFCPSLRAIRFHGPKGERNRIKVEELNDLKEFDLVVTTYEMLTAEANFFRRRYLWRVVIVDEGHRLKNEKSQLSEKIRVVPSVCRVILTGTPLQNNLRELWALLHFLMPDIFTPVTSEKFEEGFDLLRNKVDATVLRAARKLLALFMLRRVKDEIAIILPERKEITVLVPLTEAQQEWYKQLLTGLDAGTIDTVMRESAKVDTEPTAEEAEQEIAPRPRGRPPKGRVSTSEALPPANMNDSDWRRLMNLLLQLRKVCNHPYLIADAAPNPFELGEHLVEQSGKLTLLDRMLPRMREDGHRVLLFSQFTSMLDILEDYCEMRELPYVRLDGDTNRVQRRLDVRRFNAPKSPLFIFLISTRAGGLGLNLASADTVILYDSDWNPQVDLQAMERAHRIGQIKPVRVYRLVCRGSVEERMISRAEKKLFLNAMVAERSELDDNNAHEANENDISQALGVGGATMSKSELAALIRFGANAVVDQDSEGQMDDVALDRLIGRPVEGVEAGTETMFTSGEDALRDRQRKLQEVDLRQLGDTMYIKQKVRAKDNVSFNTDLILGDAKRQRKERIIHVDGKGSGYGGNIPILAENTIALDPPQVSQIRSRMRVWSHQDWCVLCGLTSNFENPVRCPHCPHSFHGSCVDAAAIPRGAGMFTCPHHKCIMCTRTTAAAGGMLFRCVGCLSSFCEDCLPEDEIESIGRWKSYEHLGYFSRQAYYIKCPYCAGFLDAEGRTTHKPHIAPGMLFSGQSADEPAADVEQDDDDAATSSHAVEAVDDHTAGDGKPSTGDGNASDDVSAAALPTEEQPQSDQADDVDDDDDADAEPGYLYPRGPVIMERVEPEPEPEPEPETKGRKRKRGKKGKGKRAKKSPRKTPSRSKHSVSDDVHDDDLEDDWEAEPQAQSSRRKSRSTAASEVFDDDGGEDEDEDPEEEEDEDEDEDEPAPVVESPPTRFPRRAKQQNSVVFLPAGLVDSDDDLDSYDMTPSSSRRSTTSRSTEKKKATPQSAKTSAGKRARSQQVVSAAETSPPASKTRKSVVPDASQQTEFRPSASSDPDDMVANLPRRCTIEEAIDILWSHPSADKFYGEEEDAGNMLFVRLKGPLHASSTTRRLRRIPSLMSARVKVDGGRYRNSDSFESDIRACLQPFIDQGKRLSERHDESTSGNSQEPNAEEREEKEDGDENTADDIIAAKELADHAVRLLTFFEQHLSPRLPTNRR